MKLFQFTPLREGRPFLFCHVVSLPVYFNSRPSARGDDTCPQVVHKPQKFQFTPLREGRPDSAATFQRVHTFQFTPLREGRPPPDDGRMVPGRISIHAPPRGATGVGARIAPPRGFQFTPLREGRLLWLSDNVCPANFNSRPSARGDIVRRVILRPAADFNSRPSARGD